MAPFLSKFSGYKSGQDPNSRHARMASANAGAIPPASAPSIKTSFENGSTGMSPPSQHLSTAATIPPTLTLTTDSYDNKSIHAPATPRKGSPIILDDTEDMYMSPDEARSSEEDRRRAVTGRRNSPAGLDLAPTQTMPMRLPSDDARTPTIKEPGYHPNEGTPKPSRGVLGGVQDNSKVDPNLGKTLGRSPSSTSLNLPNSVSQPDGLTQSRTNASHHLSLPSDGEGGISDSASIISSSGKKKKRLWKKSSTSSFLGGKSKESGGSALGAALAASGMGMANATGAMPTVSSVSPEKLRQDTMKVSSPPKDPRSYHKLRRESESSSGLYDSDDALSLNDHDMPITGFAVASSKRNNDFHDLFPDIPGDDYLIEDYGCALQKEILVQGRLYISENHMAFHANIFGWVTNFTITFSSVTGLEKRMTAFVIPNAINISTTDSKYLFASFLSRDTTFEVISNIWRLARPSSTLNGNASVSDVASTFGAASVGAVSPGSGSPPANGKDSGVGVGKKVGHRVTTCGCSKSKQHYDNTTMNVVLPGTPEKIYNLIFSSGFMKEFMSENQKLISIQISDWAPQSEGSHLLARNMSYIKPLNGAVGPKQTKCELRDETVHVDFDDWVTVLTSTRTPDVPSGNSFSIKTRTCITWAGPATARIMITSAVEWSGRSFLKAIIDKSCIDGQKQYSTDLEKAMRQYINEHRTEFLPEGTDAADVAEAVAHPSAVAEGEPGATIGDNELEARVQVERRGLQWALDTFNSAASLTSESFWGLIDILGDLWEMGGGGGMGNTKMWWTVLVVGLVAMNFWTWSSLSQSRAREKLTRDTFAKMSGGNGGVKMGYPPTRGGGEVEKDKLNVVATEAVRVFWEGVVERQDEKWRRELELEVKSLREALNRLEASLGARSVPREDL